MKKQTCFWVAVETALSLGLPVFGAESGLKFDYGSSVISTRTGVADEMVSIKIESEDRIVITGKNVNGVFTSSL